jgi:hypothetical protein
MRSVPHEVIGKAAARLFRISSMTLLPVGPIDAAIVLIG